MASRENGAAVLQKMIDSRDFTNIVANLEERELQVGGCSFVPDWPYAVQMFGYLINNDLDNSRFVYKRAPAIIKEKDLQVQAAWKITQGLWTQDYQTVHSTLKDHLWSDLVSPVARYLHDVVRARVIALVSRAYTTISTADAATFLGLPSAEAIEMVQGMGWELQSANMLKVKSVAVAEDKRTTPLQLQQLTEYVVHLES